MSGKTIAIGALLWMGRVAILLASYGVGSFAWDGDSFGARAAGLFAVLGFGAFLATFGHERCRALGGILAALGLYGGFTGTGMAMIVDPGQAIADSQANQGGKAPNLEESGDSVVLGVFFVVLVNVPLAFAVGGTFAERVRAGRVPAPSGSDI